MSTSTTDPDAGRLEERLRAMADHPMGVLSLGWGTVQDRLREAADILAALRERAERAEEQYERAMSIIREDELDDLTEQRDRLHAALEEQQEAQCLIMEEVLPKLRQLIANGCVSTAVGAIDELAATWCGVETVDQLLARRALSASPAPEVRDGK